MAAPKNMNTELGDTGVYIFDSNIQNEEYNFDLLRRRGLQIYGQMRRSDATVKAALKAVKLPIKSAEYRIDAAPAEDGDTAGEAFNAKVKRVVEASLFEFIDWKKFTVRH